MPSRNTEFLDDLRFMLGDEQYTILISKYPEERFRLPSIEGAEKITRRNQRIRNEFLGGINKIILQEKEHLTSRQLSRIINGK